MVSAQALHCEDLSRIQKSGGSADTGLASLRSVTVGLQVITRPARGTGNGLGMKTPVGGIGILRDTPLIEQPILHRRVGPVIREAQHDGVARTAVGAVNVGIPIARVGGIEKFFQAIIANRQIRRNAHRGMIAPFAGADGELAQADQLRRLDLDFRDTGGGWWLGFEVAHKSFQASLRALQMNLHSFFRIQHPAAKRVGARQAIHERAEAYALHYPSDSNGTGASHGYGITNC